jgi:hypothetical protein
MTSTRFAVPVLLLVLAAAIPTAIHGYAGYLVHDGRSARDLPMALADRYGRESERRRDPAWIRETYGSDDWIEREYIRFGEAPLTLFVARTYDLKKVYHHPELGVLRGRDFQRREVVRVGPADAPLFVLRSESGSGLALYALLYDDAPVADPIRVQIRSVLTSLVGGRRAMTLFMVFDPQGPSNQPIDGSPAAMLLLASLEAFRSTD